jgi:hypothetical protein
MDPKNISVGSCFNIRMHNLIWRALHRAGKSIHPSDITLGDISALTEHDFYLTPRFGKKSMARLQEVLAEHGLKLSG